jgi:hypothetical protein
MLVTNPWLRDEVATALLEALVCQRMDDGSPDDATDAILRSLQFLPPLPVARSSSKASVDDKFLSTLTMVLSTAPPEVQHDVAAALHSIAPEAGHPVLGQALLDLMRSNATLVLPCFDAASSLSLTRGQFGQFVRYGLQLLPTAPSDQVPLLTRFLVDTCHWVLEGEGEEAGAGGGDEDGGPVEPPMTPLVFFSRWRAGLASRFVDRNPASSAASPLKGRGGKGKGKRKRAPVASADEAAASVHSLLVEALVYGFQYRPVLVRATKEHYKTLAAGEAVESVDVWILVCALRAAERVGGGGGGAVRGGGGARAAAAGGAAAGGRGTAGSSRYWLSTIKGLVRSGSLTAGAIHVALTGHPEMVGATSDALLRLGADLMSGAAKRADTFGPAATSLYSCLLHAGVVTDPAAGFGGAALDTSLAQETLCSLLSSALVGTEAEATLALSTLVAFVSTCHTSAADCTCPLDGDLANTVRLHAAALRPLLDAAHELPLPRVALLYRFASRLAFCPLSRTASGSTVSAGGLQNELRLRLSKLLGRPEPDLRTRGVAGALATLTVLAPLSGDASGDLTKDMFLFASLVLKAVDASADCALYFFRHAVNVARVAPPRFGSWLRDQLMTRYLRPFLQVTGEPLTNLAVTAANVTRSSVAGDRMARLAVLAPIACGGEVPPSSGQPASGSAASEDMHISLNLLPTASAAATTADETRALGGALHLYALLDDQLGSDNVSRPLAETIAKVHLLVEEANTAVDARRTTKVTKVAAAASAASAASGEGGGSDDEGGGDVSDDDDGAEEDVDGRLVLTRATDADIRALVRCLVVSLAVVNWLRACVNRFLSLDGSATTARFRLAFLTAVLEAEAKVQAGARLLASSVTLPGVGLAMADVNDMLRRSCGGTDVTVQSLARTPVARVRGILTPFDGRLLRALVDVEGKAAALPPAQLDVCIHALLDSLQELTTVLDEAAARGETAGRGACCSLCAGVLSVFPFVRADAERAAEGGGHAHSHEALSMGLEVVLAPAASLLTHATRQLTLLQASRDEVTEAREAAARFSLALDGVVALLRLVASAPTVSGGAAWTESVDDAMRLHLEAEPGDRLATVAAARLVAPVAAASHSFPATAAASLVEVLTMLEGGEVEAHEAALTLLQARYRDGAGVGRLVDLRCATSDTPCAIAAELAATPLAIEAMGNECLDEEDGHEYAAIGPDTVLPTHTALLAVAVAGCRGASTLDEVVSAIRVLHTCTGLAVRSPVRRLIKGLRKSALRHGAAAAAALAARGSVLAVLQRHASSDSTRVLRTLGLVQSFGKDLAKLCDTVKAGVPRPRVGAKGGGGRRRGAAAAAADEGGVSEEADESSMSDESEEVEAAVVVDEALMALVPRARKALSALSYRIRSLLEEIRTANAGDVESSSDGEEGGGGGGRVGKGPADAADERQDADFLGNGEAEGGGSMAARTREFFAAAAAGPGRGGGRPAKKKKKVEEEEEEEEEKEEEEAVAVKHERRAGVASQSSLFAVSFAPDEADMSLEESGSFSVEESE